MTFLEDDIKARIRSATSLEWLMRLVANEQADYWHDPCGKSGHALDRTPTDLSLLAIRRAQQLLGLD